MGNDNKIKTSELIEVSKDRFLPKEVIDQDPRPPEYSLEREFAKTRRRFDFKFYSALIGFLAFVILGTIAYTTFIQQENTENALGFDIDELNLKELLTSTQKEERNVNFAKGELDNLLREKEKKIEKIRFDYEVKIKEAEFRNLPKNELKTLVENIKKEEESLIAGVEKEYEPDVKKKEKNLSEAEAKLEKKQEQIKHQQDKAQAMLDNIKKLQQMQIERIKKGYENKIYQTMITYNPYFSEPELRAIIKKNKKQKLLSSPTLFDYKESLIRAGVLTDAEHTNIRKVVSDFDKIARRIQKIPYRNSAGPAIDMLINDGYLLISEYERKLNELAIMARTLEKYKKAFREVAENSPDSGVVVDASQSTNILYTMKSIITIKDGDTALVFRKDDEYIGIIKFEEKYGKIVARIEEEVPGKKIRALDKLFLQARKPDPLELPEVEDGAMQPENEIIRTDPDNGESDQNVDDGGTGNPELQDGGTDIIDGEGNPSGIEEQP